MPTEQLPPTELTCQELVDLVSDYIENALSPEDHARVVEHLDECEGCDRYVEQMRQTIQTLGTLQENDVSPQVQSWLRELFREWQNVRRDR